MSEQQGPFDLSELRGSIAVVTGAGNNGIGWGLCMHAAGQLGMDVVVVDLHENLVVSAQNRLREMFPDVESLGVKADVTKPESLEACLATIEHEMPGRPIGAVFANAGVIFNRTILNSSMDEWSTTLNVNVIGVVNTIKTFLPGIRRQSTPSVVCTTASVGGLVRGDGGGAAYQASKHAVVALTESLSFELAVKSPQIRVHVLCPCIVASALPITSQTNQEGHLGEVSAAKIDAIQEVFDDLALTTENHAQQVFDHIAAGRFYLITDNVRPYVDHDHPFDGLALVRERFENMLELKLDNSDAFVADDTRLPSAVLKGPMFAELRRRRSS